MISNKNNELNANVDLCEVILIENLWKAWSFDSCHCPERGALLRLYISAQWNKYFIYDASWDDLCWWCCIKNIDISSRWRWNYTKRSEQKQHVYILDQVDKSVSQYHKHNNLTCIPSSHLYVSSWPFFKEHNLIVSTTNLLMDPLLI